MGPFVDHVKLMGKQEKKQQLKETKKISVDSLEHV